MKPIFHASPVNGPFEDPSVYVRVIREKRALLFDIGYIGKLETGNLLKVTDIFVSHTHIDHFIGFDIILRGILRRDIPLRIYGPENIIRCVEGKLGGYTWNLIKEYPLKIEVFEIKNDVISHASFYAENSFRRQDNPELSFNGVVRNEALFTIKGLKLSHQIPVMAYSLEEEFHINVNKALLAEMGLPVGPWLSDLKKAIRENYELKIINNESARKIDSELRARTRKSVSFKISNKIFSLEELMKIVAITRGQKISYVMDLSPTDENMEKIIPFVKGSDTLFCEAYFLEKDRDRAIERHHLTAAMAGRIAREANVGNLVIMHFSPKYRDCADELYQEAEQEFRGR
jgi:ribonuclease Z